jgi:hypothetical protein
MSHMANVFINLAMAVVFGYDLWLYFDTGQAIYLCVAAAFALWMVLNSIDRSES